MMDERGDPGSLPGSNIKNITTELLVKESGKHVDTVSETTSQSSSILSNSTDHEDSQNEDITTRIIEPSDISGPLIDESSKANAESSVKDNDNTSVLDQKQSPKEYDEDIDKNLPETITLLTTPDGGKLYLVGTAHYSVESQNDVSKIIQAVQPHMIVVELCKARIGVMQCDEETLNEKFHNMSFSSLREIIQSEGVYSGILHILMLRMAVNITKELGLLPGGEFRRAFQEAKKIPNCMIHLADRPIDITMKRALSSLSWWQVMKVAWQLIVWKDPITKEDVESCKQRAILEEMVNKIAEEFPVLGEVLVKERDLYLTYSLQMSCLPHITPNGLVPARVVGIVGIGHTLGIVENWGKVKLSDIAPIVKVPPLSLSSKILRFTIKASLISTVVYVGYKIIQIPTGITIESMKSSVQGLLKNHVVSNMEAIAHTDEYEHLEETVMYVTNNIPGPGIDIDDFELEYSVGCSCTHECLECTCTRGTANYINGKIVDGKLTTPIIECNSHCTCVEDCGNRIVQKGPLDSLVISTVGDKGLGLLTSQFISKGRFICEYAGEVISVDEARRRIEDNKRNDTMNYVLVVSEYIGERKIVTCIDPKYFGNIGRYANHSCRPNTVLVPVRVEGLIPRLCLFASRDIESNEEVTFNYAGGVDNSVHCLSDTVCLCGSTDCSGYLPHSPI